MDILYKTFEELNNLELYALLKLRSEIFVVEQNCIYNDLDGKDNLAIHVLGIIGGEIIAYARILPPNTRFKEVSVGRVVVAGKMRNRKLGREIMLASLRKISKEFNGEYVRISAQKHLTNFYSDLNFKVDSEEYLEDGIPHLEMLAPNFIQ